jgi:hypothetical protein
MNSPRKLGAGRMTPGDVSAVVIPALTSVRVSLGAKPGVARESGVGKRSTRSRVSPSGNPVNWLDSGFLPESILAKRADSLSFI